MNTVQKSLLNTLKTPAKNSGNFNIEIYRYFTDMNGTEFAKGLAPANLQVKYPFHLFFNFDKHSGYKISNFVNPPQPNTFLLYSFIVGTTFDYFFFQFGNTIKNRLNTGDIVFLYTDSVTIPSILIWIVLTSNSYNVSGAFENTSKKDLDVESILYTSDNIQNYLERLSLITSNEIGIYKSDSISPLSNKGIDTVLRDFILIDFNKKINQYFGISSNILFDTDKLIFNFKLKI
jgi:hypothetical protein